MSNKYFIHSLLIFGAFFTVSLSVYAGSNKTPNIILIYASDFGKGLLSAYGQQHFTTPNIDALFNSGVSFSNAYGSSLCTHARAAQITGYHDCNKNKWHIANGGIFIKDDTTRIHDCELIINEANIFLPENDLYLPHVFQKAGYVTGQIGKLGIGITSTRQQMMQYGWDYFYGFLDLDRSEGYYPPFIFENDQIKLIDGNKRRNGGRSFSPETERVYQERWNMDGKKTYAPDLFINKIIDFLHNNKDLPFFLMYSTPLTHGPVSIPVIHPEVADNSDLTQIEKEYASMVKLLDDQVGIIMKELQTLNLEKNTIVIFTSENGHDIHYQQKGRIGTPFINNKTGELFDNFYNKYRSADAGDIFNGNGGLAGLKYSNLEGGIRTPLAFYWKGKLEKHVCEEIIAGYDFLPTMADLVGVKLKTKKDGQSFLSMIMAKKKLPKNRYIIVGSEEGPVIITNEGWKLRYCKQKNLFELFNLKKDPAEKYDVNLRFPNIVDKMKEKLIYECSGSIENGILF